MVRWRLADSPAEADRSCLERLFGRSPVGRRRAGWRRDGSPQARRGCPPAATRGRTRPVPCPRAGVEHLLTREDIRLRERITWRMLYETATARLRSWTSPTAAPKAHRKGGAADMIVWQTGTARLLRLLKAGTSGSGVRHRPEGPGCSFPAPTWTSTAMPGSATGRPRHSASRNGFLPATSRSPGKSRG
jgi:hypothetical protein